jgi:DNA-directed RNA polymerase specialized sigma24 family protein
MGLQRTRPHWFTEEFMGRQNCWFYDYVSPHHAEYMALARRLSDGTISARRIVSEAGVELISCDHWEYITDPRRYMLRLVFDIALRRLATLQPSINYYVAPVPVDDIQQWEPPSVREINLRALDRMPALYRRTLLMRTQKGQTITEIADNLKLSPAQAEQRLARARVMFCNGQDDEACLPDRACALTDGFFRDGN